MIEADPNSASCAAERRGERGHLMAGLMVSVAIMIIFSMVAFQEWGEVLRRDNEAEMMFRAQDLVRAIQRYRLDHNAQGPQKLEDLLEPGPKAQYYARQLWEDPLVKDGKWGILYAGPGGQIVDPNAIVEGESELDRGFGSGGLGSANSSNSRNSRSGGLSNPKQTRDRNQNRNQDRDRRRDQNRNRPNSPGSTGALGGGLGGSTGERTGLPIAGVKSLCTDPPFRVYNGFTEYREWLFTYLDLEGNKGQQPGQPGGQQPAKPGGGLGGGGINPNP